MSGRPDAPAYQEYPKDRLSDGGIVAASLAAVGLFYLLKLRVWLDGTVPNDPAAVAKLLGRGPREIKRHWPEIVQLFEQTDGHLMLRDLDDQRERHAAWREKSRQGGLKSGETRRQKGASTTVEPNRGQAVEGSLNTAYSDLRTASSDLQTSSAHTRVCPSGAREREHAAHVFCGKVCVPNFIHDELVRKLNVADADARLKTWYRAVNDEFTPAIVLDASPKFWRRAYETHPPLDRSEWHLARELQ